MNNTATADVIDFVQCVDLSSAADVSNSVLA